MNMTVIWKRRLAGICLILIPIPYLGGIVLIHNNFEVLSRLILMGWMLISLLVGYLAAMTFRRHIFGINCGSVLGYSVGVIVIAFTFQVLEHPLGAQLMYGFFLISFLCGCFTLWKNRANQNQPD